MTTTPQWHATDPDTASLLDLLADDGSALPSKAEVRGLFLAACRRDAMAHGGLVSVNRVRQLLADADIPPRRYSAMWAHFTGRDKPMVKAFTGDGTVPLWEVCQGSGSGNDGRPFQMRRWVA